MRPKFLLLLSLILPLQLAATTKLLYDFETDLDGWAGKTGLSPTGATHGKGAMEIDATGSSGWNQNLAVQSKNDDYSDFSELQLDITVPQGVCGGADYIEFIPVFSGPKLPWYPLSKTKLKDGLNKIVVPMDGSKVGAPWKFHLVLNSGKAIPGKIYVDNIRMKAPGKEGTLDVMLKDAQGAAVAGAHVALGKLVADSDASGKAEFKEPADLYPGEIIGDGVVNQKFEAGIEPGRTASKLITVTRKARLAPKPARAWVMEEKAIRTFDAHKIYGHNIATWNGADPFKNPIHLQKLKDAKATFIRIPGGGYANQWNWRNGNVYKADGSLDWTPEANWGTFVQFFHDLGPESEALIIANIMQMEPQDTIDWIKDARDKGIRVRYVELGNEPDLDPKIPYKGKPAFWTSVDNYVSVYVKFAKAIRAAYPDIKIMGPCNSQIVHKECAGKDPWLCQKEEHEYWVQKFLRLVSAQGDLVDVISFHSYPFWPGDAGYEAGRAFETTKLMAEWMPKYKGWVKQYLPKKADTMEYALTEYHIQVPENSTTVKRVSGVWHANYLAEFIKNGGDIANAWDLNTTKPADGGGHGMLDISGDPTRPYSERAKYWALKMMANGFTGTMVQSQVNAPEIAAYGAKNRGRNSVLLINKSENQPMQVSLQVSGIASAKRLRIQKLTSKEYEWSEVLYRPIVNIDPTGPQSEKTYGAPAASQGWRVVNQVLDPMSVYLLIFE